MKGESPKQQASGSDGASNAGNQQAAEALKKIEWMLSGQPSPGDASQTEHRTQDYGDLTVLNRDGMILEAIGRERLESFANDYLELLGTSSAIYEVNGDYAFGIFTSGWCRMMDCASRRLCGTSDNAEALNSGRWLCHESCWTECSRRAIAESGPVDIACNGGLRIYAIPILAHDKVVGAINFGYGDPPTDPEQVQTLATTYQLDVDDLVREAEAYDSRPPFVIELARKRLHATARLIGAMIETKQAEDALHANEKTARALLDASSDAAFLIDVSGKVLAANDEVARRFRRKTQAVIGESIYDLLPPEVAARRKAWVDHVVRTGEPVTEEDDRAGRVIDNRVFPVVDAAGQVTAAAVYGRDITEQRAAEEKLRASEMRHRRLLETLSEGVWAIDAQGQTTYVNQQMAEMLGYTVVEMQGKHLFDFMDGAAATKAKANMQRRQQGITEQHEFVFQKKTGEAVHALLSTSPLLDADGNYVGALAGITDITERKRAEENQRAIEAQLQQAQKMESIGRLAGGVAHDFNNLLMGILNYADLCRDDIGVEHPSRKWLDEITREAERLANLTRQLLAFARKQTVAPQILDLNDAVGNILKMLRRLIGEDIDLAWQPSAKLWPVRIDPSQLDQILANLCVNARDAIGLPAPLGAPPRQAGGTGKVTIETENVTIDEDYCAKHAGAVPGDYILLSVSDDGCGMDRETLDNAFEPFFATKGVGEGTGLGLATVYGIAKQNDGYVSIYSELGEGTTVRIYLPRVAESAAPVEAGGERVRRAEGDETILLVEDEASIRQTVGMLLERLGYTVLTAETPEAALHVAAGVQGPIHLLITDVIMPGMSGRELAQRLLEDAPDLKVLYMSGYTADVIAHRGILDKGVHFLSKPFSSDILARTVRQLLDDP